MHESLAVCLTIRQNELRLGRQQISSRQEEAFKIRLLTSLKNYLTMGGRKNEIVEEEGGHGSVTVTSIRVPIPPPMSLLAAVRRQSTTFVCTPCRVRTYVARIGKKDRNPSVPVSSTKLPPAETTYSELQYSSAVSACSHLTTFFRWRIFVSTRHHSDRT